MEIKFPFSFQVDSDIVRQYYENHDNYRIEYSEGVPKTYCIIYFSSNDIYYPNTEAAFREQLMKQDKFEWYKTRITKGYKHIFIRDIQKQWHINGINSKINTPEKLYQFLASETKGYKVITIGSSAGGFASVLFGQLLKAEKIISFNGNFELISKLKTSNEEICPLLFRNQHDQELIKWYDTRNFITDPDSIFYFQSIFSKQDVYKYNQVNHIPINRIQFKNSHHGIPFLKTNLPVVLNWEKEELVRISKKANHPIWFSIQTIGFIRTLESLFSVAKSAVIKKFKRKMASRAIIL